MDCGRYAPPEAGSENTVTVPEKSVNVKVLLLVFWVRVSPEVVSSPSGFQVTVAPLVPPGVKVSSVPSVACRTA